jgi:HPt (histidine-containing phosphotransfer) domain-containing protein
MGKRSFYEKLVRQFVQGEQAHAADDVRNQLANGDHETAQRTAHSLRGVAGTLGAAELHARAEALELAIKMSVPEHEVRSRLGDVDEELSRMVGAMKEALALGDEEVGEGTGLEPADFDVLPAEEMTRMRDALEEGDLDTVQATAESLGEVHPALAAELVERCEAFDYEGLGRYLATDRD